jgi:hypothetical protein
MLTGAVVCEASLLQNSVVCELRKQIAAIAKVPCSLQTLVFENDNLEDAMTIAHLAQRSPCPGVFPVQLVQLSLEIACETPAKLRHTLSELTDWGPDAIVAYADEIVSIVQKQPGLWDYEAHQVLSSCCCALKKLGSQCAPYVRDIMVCLRGVINETAAAESISDMMSEWKNKGGDPTHFLKGDENFRYRSSSMKLQTVFANISSVLSSMGSETTATIMDSFPAIFKDAGPCQKGLALLSIARAMPMNEVNTLCVSWFATFLDEPIVPLQWCAVHSLCHVLENAALHHEMEAYICKVVPLLTRRDDTAVGACPLLAGELADHRSLQMGGCMLLAKLGHLVVPYTHDIIIALLSNIDCADANAAINGFRHCMQKKSHSSYMYSWLKKAASSAILGFSRIFNAIGYDGFRVIIGNPPTIWSKASPCQKALVLLAAARPLPTFSKSAAAACSAWFSCLLKDPNWEMRMCAIHCLQRTMAGNMVPHAADAIAAMLVDDVPFVRQSAATALGCLGRRAVLYRDGLLRLLSDDCCHVRYASLVTLGCLLAQARPLDRHIAVHLNDKSAKCRMAALRVLKCMGKTARPYIEELTAWQQRWSNQCPYEDPEFGKKPEPITTRALLFPDVPLRKLFKGHAPLGNKFVGAKAVREQRRDIYNKVMCQRLFSPADLATFQWGDLVPAQDYWRREDWWSDRKYRCDSRRPVRVPWKFVGAPWKFVVSRSSRLARQMPNATSKRDKAWDQRFSERRRGKPALMSSIAAEVIEDSSVETWIVA